MTLTLAIVIAVALLAGAAVVVVWGCCAIAGQCDDEEGVR